MPLQVAGRQFPVNTPAVRCAPLTSRVRAIARSDEPEPEPSDHV